VSEIAHPDGLTRAFQLPAKYDIDLTVCFGVRISPVFQNTFPGVATWKHSSRKSCHLSNATLDGGTRRRNTWKNLQVVCRRRNGRNGIYWPPFITSERKPIQN
jgi:hypothetical protein